MTLITDGHVPDEVYAQARAQFSEQELADLTLAVIAINGANRLNIAFRTVPGSYRARPRAGRGIVGGMPHHLNLTPAVMLLLLSDWPMSVTVPVTCSGP